VLFLHDVGPELDLDRWGRLPEIVHARGHDVLAIDLPGHGLSEGVFSAEAGIAAVQAAHEFAMAETGHSPAIVVAGGAAELVAPLLEPACSLSALIIFSPRSTAASGGICPRLAFCGALEERASAAADQFLRASRGWTLVSSFGTAAQGHDLLATPHAAKIADQLIAFLRDYDPAGTMPRR
jgi:pimeloyl-ACP methyl ester carboxylesterase